MHQPSLNATNASDASPRVVTPERSLSAPAGQGATPWPARGASFRGPDGAEIPFLGSKARDSLPPGLMALSGHRTRKTREASVKIRMFAALVFASALAAGTAAAQPAAFNDIGVTMGHWHIASKDVEANKKLFL